MEEEGSGYLDKRHGLGATVIPQHVTQSVQKAFYSLPAKMSNEQARVMVYAIGLQESKFLYRRQMIEKGGKLVPDGPAKGYWQFERGGGCRGVINHSASRYWMHDLCEQRHVQFDSLSLWNAIENDDILAAAAARLLLFTDPFKLPAVGDEQGAWDLYARVWRPGKPHPEDWPANYGHAVGHVIG